MTEDQDNLKGQVNEAAQLQALLKKINDLRNKLGKKPIQLTDVGNLETAEALLSKLRDQTEGFGEDVGYLVQDWTKVIGAVTKTSEAIRQSNKSLNTLRDISRQVANVQEGLTDMSSRELKKLGDKAKAAASELNRNRELLAIKIKEGKATQDEVEYHQKLNDELQHQSDIIAKTNEAIKEQARRQKNVEKSMGLTGLALGGIEGLLGKIGLSGIGDMFGEARDKAKEMADRVTEGGNKTAGLTGRLKILGAGFGSLLKSAWGMLNPLNLITAAIGGITKLFGHVKEKAEEGRQAVIPIADAVTNLSRDLGLAEGAAGKLAGAVAGAGPSFEASAASVGSIYKALGSTEKIAPNILKQFVQLNIYAGMSAESLSKFYKFSKLSGDNAGKVVKNMSDTALQQIKNLKLSTSMKGLLEEVSNVSDTVKIRFAGQEKALVKTVAMSKKLGVEMKKMEDMAKGLLNFEDSIAAEMEAELLTGKQLNLEKARELALQGKSEEAAKLLIEQAGGLQEFQQMNVVQQEAMAKAIGMSRDEMAGMLVKQKENVSLQGDLVDGQKDGQAAMKSGMSASEKEAARQRAAQADSMKYYNRLAPVMETLEETWNNIKGHLFELLDKNVLKPFMEWFNSPAGQEFFKVTLPRAIDNFFKKIQGLIDFMKNSPTFKLIAKILGAGYLTVKGLDMIGLTEPLKKLGTSLIEKIPGSDKFMNALGMGKKKDGSSPNAAMYVQIANSDMLANAIADEQANTESNKKSKKNKKGKTKASKSKTKTPRPRDAKGRFKKQPKVKIKGGRFGKFLGGLTGKFGKLFPVFGKFTGFLSGLGPKIFNGIKGGLSKAINGIKGGFSKVINGIKGGFSKVISGIGSGLSKAMGGISNFVSKGFSSIKNFVSSGAKGAVSKAGGFLSKAGGFFSKAASGAGSFFSKAGAFIKDTSKKAISKAGSTLKALNPVNALKSKAGASIMKGLGKALGPITTGLFAVNDIMGIVNEARMDAAAGKKVNTASLGKNILKSAAYPLATLLLNFIPGVGNLISGADMVLGMFGLSPIKWLTDNLMELLPDSVGSLIGDSLISPKNKPSPQGKDLLKVNDPAMMKAAPKAADFISRPGMPLQTFRADDIIIGGTKLLGGGSSKEQQHVIKLLERLVMLVEKGGDIHIDGSKVGKAVVMNSSKIR